MTIAIATNDEAAFAPIVANPMRIPGDLYGFAKWKNSLLRLIGAASGVAVEILKVNGNVTPNVVFYGTPDDITNAFTAYRWAEKGAFAAVCASMKADGVPSHNNVPYSVSFYNGFGQAIAARLQDAVIAREGDVASLVASFPNAGTAYPTHKNIDSALSAAGYAFGMVAVFGPAAKPEKAPKVAKATKATKAATVTVIHAAPIALNPAPANEVEVALVAALAELAPEAVTAQAVTAQPATIAEVPVTPKKVTRKSGVKATPRKK